MKIAVFHNLPPGGAKRVLYEQVKYLSQENDIDLFEFASTDEQFLDARPFCKNIYTFPDTKPFINHFKRLIEDTYIFWGIKNAHKKIASKVNTGGYDVALVHPDKYTQAPFLLKYLKVPSLYYCHEWLRIAYEKELRFDKKVSLVRIIYEKLSRNVKKKIDKENARRASTIATNSEYTKGNIREAYDKNSTVIYPGVDLDIFRPFGKKINQIILVGEPVEINGYKLLTSAYKLLKKINKPSIKVIHASKMKNTSDVVLSKEYSKSLIAMCLSFSEPFGLSAIESMACGTPVIAVDEGGYKETVKNGKTGYLVKRDPRELAEKIKILLDLKINKQFSLRSNLDAVNNWSWEKHNKELISVLSHLANNHAEN